jgi:predicted O-methyltransferase YrrM
VGAALETLPTLAGDPRTPFDLVFIDADKVNTKAYFEWALKLTRPGSLIIVDNVVRKGAVADASSEDVNVQGIRQFNAAAAANPRVTGTALQTVGSKGYDGLAVLRVIG